jgi:hypothetical protein
MDLANHQVHGFRRGHDGDAHAFRRLWQFARPGIAITVTTASAAEATLAISAATRPPLRTEFTASATATCTAPSWIAAVIAPGLPPVVPTSPVVAIPTLAGSFVVTDLR